MEWRLVRDQLEWKIVSDGMQCVLQLNFWLRFAEFLVLSPIPDPYGTSASDSHSLLLFSYNQHTSTYSYEYSTSTFACFDSVRAECLPQQAASSGFPALVELRIGRVSPEQHECPQSGARGDALHN